MKKKPVCELQPTYGCMMCSKTSSDPDALCAPFLKYQTAEK